MILFSQNGILSNNRSFLFSVRKPFQQCGFVLPTITPLNHHGLLFSVRTPFHLQWFCVLSRHSIPITVDYCSLSGKHSTFSGFVSQHSLISNHCGLFFSVRKPFHLPWFCVISPQCIPTTEVYSSLSAHHSNFSGLCSQLSLHRNHRRLYFSLRKPYYLLWFCGFSPHSTATTVVSCTISAHHSINRGFVFSSLNLFLQPWLFCSLPAHKSSYGVFLFPALTPIQPPCFTVLCPHTIPPTLILCFQFSLHCNNWGFLISVRTSFHLTWFCVLSPHYIPNTIVYCSLPAHHSNYIGFLFPDITPYQPPWFIVLCPLTIPPIVVLCSLH